MQFVEFLKTFLTFEMSKRFGKKTNRTMKTLTPLTESQAKRVNKDILHTNDLLNRELKFSEDLQKKDLISFYRSHIEKLQGMIENGWEAPKFK